MENWHTFGHSAVKNTLNKQLETKIFPHAYLFLGPKGVGKKTLAAEFTAKVLGTENLQNHPDFQILDVEGEITTEVLQNFMRGLAFKPFVGLKKVAIINNAQNLNKNSANSLLKTLEEPGPSTILILVASGAVLPTIASRCQIFNFSLFSNRALMELAEQRGGNNLDAINLSFGSSGKLIKLFQDKDFLNAQIKLRDDFFKLKNSSLGDKILAIASISENDNPEIKQDLTNWMFLQVNELKNKPEEFFKVSALINAISGLEQNFNKKMVLQGLITKI
jgi:DNA polymerase-3 subunit delta'